jgi:hypothetical protein
VIKMPEKCYGTVWEGTLALQARLAFWSARAHPSWIIRGVSPLHHLLGRSTGGQNHEVETGRKYVINNL